MYIGPRVKYPIFMSDLICLEFSRHIFQKYLISNFIKFRLVGAQFYADGRTDWQTNLIFAVRKFLQTRLKSSNFCEWVICVTLVQLVALVYRYFCCLYTGTLFNLLTFFFVCNLRWSAAHLNCQLWAVNSVTENLSGLSGRRMFCRVSAAGGGGDD